MPISEPVVVDAVHDDDGVVLAQVGRDDRRDRHRPPVGDVARARVAAEGEDALGARVAARRHRQDRAPVIRPARMRGDREVAIVQRGGLPAGAGSLLAGVDVQRMRRAVEQLRARHRHRELGAVEAHHRFAAAIHAIGRDGAERAGDALSEVLGLLLVRAAEHHDGDDHPEQQHEQPGQRLGAPPQPVAAIAAWLARGSWRPRLALGGRACRGGGTRGTGGAGGGGHVRAAGARRRRRRRRRWRWCDATAGQRLLARRVQTAVGQRGRRRGGGPAARALLTVHRVAGHLGEGARRGVAMGGLLGGGAGDDVVEGGDQLGPDRARQRRRVGDVRPELGHVAVPVVGDLPGQHLEQHAAQRVHVGAAVDGVTLDLLGRDVVGRSHPAALTGERLVRRAQPLGQAEVGEVDVRRVAAAGDEDVGGLDVAVDEALRVRGVQGAGHLRDDVRDPTQLHRLRVDDLAQVRARHEAHRQVEDALELTAAMDRHYVRVLERRGQAALGLEASDGGLVLRVLGRDDLQRDLAIEVGVDGLVDDAHAAPVQQPLDAVAGEHRAGLEMRQTALGIVGQRGHLGSVAGCSTSDPHASDRTRR